MVTIQEFRTFALSLSGAEEQPHFERASFRVKGKIFATLDEKQRLGCLMFSPENQSIFCGYNPEVIYPVPNKWGAGGATYFDLKNVRKDVLRDALRVAWEGKGGKTLATKKTK